MRKGIFTYRNDITLDKQYELIQKAGFDSVMIWWGEDKEDYIDLSKRYRLEICNAHLPYVDARRLWIPDNDGDEYAQWLCDQIIDLGSHGVYVAVLHVSRGIDTSPCNEKGLERIKRIAEAAGRANVRVAVENLRLISYLDYIFSHVHSDNIGFCYDSGHHNYMSPERDLLSDFGDKLIALHLNDNMGDDDSHMLPYDGTADWDEIIDKIASTGYDSTISLEVQQERHIMYSDIEPYEFFCMAFDKALKVEKELIKRRKNCMEG